MEFSTSRRSLLLSTAALSLTALTPGLLRAAEGSRAIVIYYSRTGTVEGLAQEIARHAKADILRLDVKVPYAEAYEDMTYGAQEEVRTNARRELSTVIPDLSGYDTVFLGSPYWWGSISVPVNTFLMDHPLAGKKVFPFIVSASSSPSGAVSRIRERCAQATVGRHFHVTQSRAGSATAALDRWVDEALK
ncbi:flavodoxin [Sutterella sp.]|uniref:flavodoxin n=1 Tax=Sutterella sp. TaxID=1981025 RepID=UPI0026E020B2|nr:flavodoxin [Sutterella sp.]MDO5531489.1 flavodoxin [Sutterella sp.]